MENHRLVMPEHLNHYGYLYGGQLLKWVDEIAWIAASLDYPGHRFVTIGLNKVEFRRSIRDGSILKFSIDQANRGTTSVSYTVTVICDDIETGNEVLAFSTQITFVSVDQEGGKRPIQTD